MKNRIKFILVTILSISALQSYAQSQVDIKSDLLRKFRGIKGEVFTGHVRFVQGTTTVYCDSAIYIKGDDRVNAFGNVRVINQEDSLNITSKELYYDARTRRARLRSNVVYRGPDFTLYTDFLDYDMTTKKANYYNGGRIVDEQMNLKSVFGDFDPATDQMIFRTQVVLNDPQGIVRSNYLRYNTAEGMAYFEGPTTIVGSDGKVIDAKEGAQYNTNTRQFSGTETRIEDGDFIITGDQSSFEEGYRRIIGNVNLFSKTDSVTVTGQEAIYDEANGLTTVFGKPLLQKPFGGDTLWLTADTLVSYQGSEESDKRLLAYHQVRIFKSDLQGVADSLVYNFTDSMIYFYQKPAIWSEGTQISGDSIWLKIGGGQVQQLNTYQNSFVISKVNSRRYNQIKGREMQTYFKDNRISMMNVTGNGESIYFQVEFDSLVSGMNKMVCSNMRLTFEDNTISRIKFYKDPEASFIPVQEISASDTQLEGFEWRAYQRPTRKAVILGLAPPEPPKPAPSAEAGGSAAAPDGEGPVPDAPLPRENMGEDEG